MKKQLSHIFVALLCATTLSAQINSGEELLNAMHQRYAMGPCKRYAFSQKNTHYKADTVSGHSEWHEYVEFPDKFRIDFGDKSAGNFVVFKHDSLFNFKAGKLSAARPDSNTLLLLLGGMYYRDLQDVKARLLAKGFQMDLLSANTWNGEEVFVLGAMPNDLSKNQIWISKKTMRVLRILENGKGSSQRDMRFEAHQEWCKGYVETKVSFRRNGQLEQFEEYYDLREIDRFPEN